MIVVSSSTPKETTPEPPPSKDWKHCLTEMFHKELDAYCTYKSWTETTSDVLLQMAVEEIMLDEYLHAKFLREYMMENKMYVPNETDVYEKKFWKAQEELFGE